jgi:dTDP-4-dehydrorhamnose 3,5-epimerase
MKVTPTELPGVLVIEPKLFSDPRGFFLESYNRRKFNQATGLDVEFVQDNQSFSVRNVLRGLHYQIRQPQGKLVQVLAGEIYDVVVDIRRSSPSFGRWTGVNLSGGTHRMLWVPVGFAHGFLACSEHAIVQYKVTDFYAPEYERTILWSDRELGIKWPLEGAPIVNAKDAQGMPFRSAELFDRN